MNITKSRIISFLLTVCIITALCIPIAQAATITYKDAFTGTESFRIEGAEAAGIYEYNKDGFAGKLAEDKEGIFLELQFVGVLWYGRVEVLKNQAMARKIRHFPCH